MAEWEKVIKGLEACIAAGVSEDENPCASCPYFFDEFCQSAIKNDALTLLREQEPVRQRWTHPAVDMNVMMCGSCGIEIPLGKPNYCPWCGKAVKWND